MVHRCLQDYSALPHTLHLPSGCSLWLEEEGGGGEGGEGRGGDRLLKLGEEMEGRRRVGGEEGEGLEVVSTECLSLGLSQGSHMLGGLDYWYFLLHPLSFSSSLSSSPFSPHPQV